MKPQNALSKRIKRHVTSQKHDFFIITTPGFEKVCARELRVLAASDTFYDNPGQQSPSRLQEAPDKISRIQTCPGGVAFQGRVHDCYLANLMLRTANRILMRLENFKATNFIQLKKKLAGIPWEFYLYSNHFPAIQVTTSKSRLYHTQAIQSKFIEAIHNRMQSVQFLEPDANSGNPIPQIFVRIVHDRFVVSLDSTGDLLYRRGFKKHGGQAPIRETIAAAALQLAGFPQTIPLIDPMCGTGTFSLEGAMALAGMPAGANRNFAFMGWPCFRPNRFNYLKKLAEQQMVRPSQPMIFASDIDSEACRRFTESMKDTPFSKIIDIRTQNFFELQPSNLGIEKGLIALNPPYGNRLDIQTTIAMLYTNIYNHLIKHFYGWKLLLVIPEGISQKQVPFRVKRYRFAHGGLSPTLLVGEVASPRE